MNDLRIESEQRLHQETENVRQQLNQHHGNQIQTFTAEFNKLQRVHEESLDILREENDSIREQIDEKNLEIKKLKGYREECKKLRKEFEAKEVSYKEQLQNAAEEIARLKVDYERIPNPALDGNATVQVNKTVRGTREGNV